MNRKRLTVGELGMEWYANNLDENRKFANVWVGGRKFQVLKFQSWQLENINSTIFRIRKRGRDDLRHELANVICEFELNGCNWNICNFTMHIKQGISGCIANNSQLWTLNRDTPWMIMYYRWICKIKGLTFIYNFCNYLHCNRLDYGYKCGVCNLAGVWAGGIKFSDLGWVSLCMLGDNIL